jgi:hypothetical protein
LLLFCVAASAKNKKKILLPADVLQARTVYVLIDPNAGMAVDAPSANRIAREDVEKALQRWGRFSLTMEQSTADLIITVRKGTGKVAQPTIGGIPNDRPVVIQSTDSTNRVGGRSGNPPYPGAPEDSSGPTAGPHTQEEIGQSQDAFVVYRGGRDRPLELPPVWRFESLNALQSPNVPAVEQFQKLVAEAEKQQSADKP